MATKTKDNAAAGHQPVGKNISETRRVSRLRRHARLRKKIAVDDLAGATLAAASSIEADVRALDGDKKAQSTRVGQLIAERAKTAGIDEVVFDRGGYTYGGRIAALADAAREGGLKF